MMKPHGGKQLQKVAVWGILSQPQKTLFRNSHVTDDVIDEGDELVNLRQSRQSVACENIRFSSLFARNIPSGEERGETDVFAG